MRPMWGERRCSLARYPRWESNPHWSDFKSLASAGWATRARHRGVEAGLQSAFVRHLTMSWLMASIGLQDSACHCLVVTLASVLRESPKSIARMLPTRHIPCILGCRGGPGNSRQTCLPRRGIAPALQFAPSAWHSP